MARFWRSVAAVTTGAAVLAACSSSGASKGIQTTTPPGGATTGATAPPPPAVSGQLSGPGVTANTITIGQIATVTGPVPGLFKTAEDGLDAYVAYLNSMGGIDGHTVKVVHLDDGLNCTNYTNEFQQLAGSTFAVVGTISVVDSCGEKTLTAVPDFPDVQALELSPALYSYHNVFAPTPMPPGYSTAGYQWIKDHYPSAITKAAALIPQLVSANGKQEQLAAESIGYRYVYTRQIGETETNFTADILRMKNSGVKVVDLGVVPVQLVADFLQQAAQQGLKLDAVISPTAYDDHLFPLLGGSAAAANGVLYAPLGYALYLGQDRNSVPELNTFLTWLDRVHPGETADIYSLSAWGAGMLFSQALANAGATVNQATVVSALNSVGSFNSGGLTATFQIGARQGAHCVVVAEVQGGQWKRVDPPTGFECNGTYHNVPLSALGG